MSLDQVLDPLRATVFTLFGAPTSALAVFGWWKWPHGSEIGGALPVTRTSAREWRAPAAVGGTGTVGKFYPPHRGHQHLIRTTVAMLGSPVESLSIVDRVCRLSAEDATAGRRPLLVCDNDAWAATVWAARHLCRPCAVPIDDRRPAIHLVTDHVGVPFEQDGRRDGEHLRAWMTARFVRGLRERGVPWALPTGTPEHRLRRAVRACAEVTRTRLSWTDPLMPRS